VCSSDLDFRNEDYDEETQRQMGNDTFVYQLSYKFTWNKKGANGKLSNFGGLIKKEEMERTI